MQKLQFLQCFSCGLVFGQMASQIGEAFATVGDLDEGELPWCSASCLLVILTLCSPFSPEWWAAGKTAPTASTPPRELETSLHKTTLLSRPAAWLCTAVHDCKSKPPPSQTCTTATTCEPKQGLRASLERSILHS